jgi:hypothetical protein
MQQYKPWHISYWSQTWQQLPAADKNRFGVLLLIHFILSFLFIQKQGILFDESDYYSYAYQWLKGSPMRSSPIMDSKTPMMIVSFIPVLLKSFFRTDILQHDLFFFLKLGRPFMYIYQALGMYTMLCWLRKINNNKWFLTLLLYAFDPLIFSYGMIVGSDLAGTAILISLMYCAWRFVNTNQTRYFLLVSTFTAFGVVTKASMLYCYPLLLLLFFLQYKKLHFAAMKKLGGFLLFVFIQLIVINLSWYFTGTFTRFGSYHFESAALQKLQHSFSFLSSLPLLLPSPFIQGIDMLQHHAEIGGCLPESTYRGVWLFNKVWCNQSVWFYYIATALYKLPLFTWLLVVIAIAQFILVKLRANVLKQKLFIWLPFVYFLLILSLTNKFQIGIRHAIILLPFLFLMISSAANSYYEKKRNFFYTAFALHCISIGFFIPNLIAYTNELILNKTNAYRIIRDSSIDYGQSRPWINNFISKHPEYKQPTNIPDTGKFIIAIGDLYAEHEGEKKNIAWLRNNFNATASYRYSLLLFEVSEKDLADRKLR